MRLDQALEARQRQFYDAAGASAFHGTVPFRLSTSRAMARLVLEVGQAFARSQRRPRLRIVDLGAGSGRLVFHLAQRAPADVTFVLVDGSAAMVESWSAHPALGRLAADGRVQLCHARAETIDSLGEILRTGPDEALLVIGTYLFDSLPHVLLEGPEGRLGSITDHGVVHFDERTNDGFLRSWAARLNHGMAFVPTGALRLLCRLEHSLTQPTLFVCADKGARSVDESREGQPLRLASHAAGASVFVNFDALRCWLGWRGWVEAAGNEPDFVIGATLLARGTARVDELAPIWSKLVHPLQAQRAVTALRQAKPAVLVPAVLALEPDGDVVLELADALVAAAPAPLSPELKQALGGWLLDAVRTSFHVPTDDVAFHAGRVLQRLGFAGAAASCFGHSLAHHGEHASARFNLAVCLAELGERAEAQRALHLVLASDPTHARALELLQSLIG